MNNGKITNKQTPKTKLLPVVIGNWCLVIGNYLEISN
jgi:hypothetical protein